MLCNFIVQHLEKIWDFKIAGYNCRYSIKNFRSCCSHLIHRSQKEKYIVPQTFGKEMVPKVCIKNATFPNRHDSSRIEWTNKFFLEYKKGVVELCEKSQPRCEDS